MRKSPKAQGIKAKSDKWYCVTLRSFCRAKEPIVTVKRCLTKWETIIANYFSEK